MNRRESILEAWMMIEHLSEGDINLANDGLMIIDENVTDLFSFFKLFLNKKKDEEKLSDEKFKQSGILIYFDIFNFNDIIEVLRKKYNISKTNEEISYSKKFSFSFYLDNQLKFYPDNFFLTASGYIRYNNGKIPNDLKEEEALMSSKLNQKFNNEDFNSVFEYLFQRYNVSINNIRYKFVKNIKNGDNLN